MQGVYRTVKKNGDVWFRAGITYKGKHISLASFSSEAEAASCYSAARSILDNPDISILEIVTISPYLPFDKVVSLCNFRDNDIYFKTPIYIAQNQFYYYLSADEIFLFDREDLFYYSEHRIIKRGGHLYVNDYGMQYNILNRYGIKNYAVAGVDYHFANGDDHDFRYSNIIVDSHYHGVSPVQIGGLTRFRVKIHLGSDRVIGTYKSEVTAAIAYNKAADYARAKGYEKAFPQNYIPDISPRDYAEKYTKIKLPVRYTESFK